MPENSPRFNDRRQHTSPSERDAASDTSHDPRTRSVPTSSAPPSSRDARATLSPAPTTLASTRIGARRLCVCSESSETTSLVSAALSRRASSPRLACTRPASRPVQQHERAAATTRPSSCRVRLRLPSARFLVSLFGSFLLPPCSETLAMARVHSRRRAARPALCGIGGGWLGL